MLSILDTSALIGGPGEPIEGELGISIVSIAELQFGVLVARSDEQRAHRLARVGMILRRFDPIPVDQAVAASYAELAAATRRAGRQAAGRSLDLLIAATAHANGAHLVTANPSDFAHLGDLVTVVPIQPAAD